MFIEGRQNTGYQKLCLINFWFFDMYLLKYPTGSSIPKHTDPVPGKRHWRLNYELRKARRGGNFNCSGNYFRLGRLYVFRSDILQHEVSTIQEGSRLVLSIGVAI